MYLALCITLNVKGWKFFYPLCGIAGLLIRRLVGCHSGMFDLSQFYTGCNFRGDLCLQLESIRKCLSAAVSSNTSFTVSRSKGQRRQTTIWNNRLTPSLLDALAFLTSRVQCTRVQLVKLSRWADITRLYQWTWLLLIKTLLVFAIQICAEII